MNLEKLEKQLKLYIELRDFKGISDLIGNANKDFIEILRKNLRKLLKSGMCPNMVRILLGRTEIEAGNFDRACDYFNKLECNTEGQKSQIYLELAKLEIKRNNLDKAREYCSLATSRDGRTSVILGEIELLSKNYQLSRKHFKKGLIVNNSYCYLKLALVDIHEQKYDSALDNICLYVKASKEMNYGVSMIILFLCKELNVFIKDFEVKYYLDRYTTKQIINYSLSETIEHIKKHAVLDEKNDHFNVDVDLKQLINKAINMLDENDKISSAFCDVYVIYYPNIGVKGSNYLKVVTLPNTKKIITMYPINTKTECDEYKIDDTKVLKMC